jgi:glycosyltransferase involved in cell wall biosynthesis
MKTFLDVFPHLEGKTTFVHNGIDTAEFDSCPQKTSAGRYILTVSTCKPQKGIDVLVRAFQRLHDSDPALKLLIAGDGPLRGELTELASSSGIQSHIEFLGWKGREEVVRVLQGCEVFVLPSRFETFGIAILEAWACGKPVVATTAGGIPEIVENGKNGILVEPDNPAALAQALASVLQDSALRSAIAANGYTTLHRRFLRKHTGSAYETAFANLLASSGKQLAGATTERSV